MIQCEYLIAHVLFGQEPIWQTLSRGLIRSIHRNTSANGLKKQVQNPVMGNLTYAQPQHVANFNKLAHWRKIVHQADCPLVLVDADCLVLGQVDCAFEKEDRDIILTSRGNKWVNAGVVFVRPGEVAQRFFDEWVWEDEQVLYRGRKERKPDTPYHIVGQNQISLWNIYRDWEQHIGWVDCETYNSCEDRYWRNHQLAKVIHVKSALRVELKKALIGRKVRRYPELVGRIASYYDGLSS